jgi:hypothetical protein
MRTRLYLEGINLDLYEDIDTTFTYVIDDVKEFGSRNTSFSKTITIPGNAVNNKAFGHIFNLGSANDYDSTSPNIGYNFNASVSARCIVFIDQVQVFKGSLRLLEIVDTAGELEYQCFVFGELGGFIFELGNRRLQDIDFSDYDLVYSVANIKSSWDNVDGQGVAFPLIDYGNVSTNKEDFQYKAFRPALYVRDYLERIISGTTYTVQSNFFLTALFDRLAIPHNQKRLTKRSTALLDRVASEQTTIDPAFNIEFETGTYGAFTSANNIVYTYAAAPSNANINLFVDVDSTGFPSEPVDIRIIKNSTTIASQLVDFAGTFNLIVNNEPFNTGDTLRVQISTNTRGASITYSAEIQATTQTQIDTEVVLGDTIIINDTIPKGVFQRDFFIWILKMFNLLVYESQFDDKTIIISTFDEFNSNNANTAVDWTDKIDRSQPIRQIPMSELNARYYQYKFKEDNDFYSEEYRKAYNEGYGDFIYDTEFEFSKETDVLEVGFANSVLYQNVGTDKVYPAIYKLSGSTETPMDHVIRIVQLKKITGIAAWDILDNLTVLDNPTSYLYCGHVNDPDNPTNDICFGAPQSLQFQPTGDYPATNVFNSFHSGYMSEITDKDSKLVVAYAYLNTVDIMNLDFSKLIYVDGVLFRLNKINEYNPTDLGTTQIQLLKVINLI